MFYCSECSNIYDITKTVQNVQVGGADTETSQSGAGMDVEDILDMILSKKNVSSEDIQTVGWENIVNHKDYKQLSKDKKELVYNTVQDKLPDEQKLIMKQSTISNNIAFFICKNCGNFEKIKPGSEIFSKESSAASTASFSSDYSYHNFLVRTRRYNCHNAKCDTHDNPGKKEAVIHRLKNSYQLRYVCTVCNTDWLQ